MTETDSAVQSWTRRVRLVAVSAVLVALAFVQHPGWTAPDTKLDLTANPSGLLGRALVLWDPTAAAGQLQNQAYGYLFPMGPFFWVHDALGVPGWVTQRLWWATILLVGFHGTRVLLERLEIGTEASRLVAAAAYALAPRMLMGLGAVSSEIWPMAVAPWVLVPLVRFAPGSERRAAMLSGLAVLLVGAVNATATIAVLIPGGLWILTRARPVRTRLLGWWAAAVTLATLWWVVPLLLLGRYSPPFLDWIESAAVTTAPASLPETLRGTTQWIAGITGSRGPLWIAGFEILTSRVTVAMGLLVAVVGLLGLWTVPRRWGVFARVLLVVGLLLVTMGRVGDVTGVGAAQVATLLDGPLAPFRNAHKFEPLVRLAVVMGLAHALPRLHRWAVSVRAPWPRLGYAVVVLAIVAQAAFPALTGVSQRGRYLQLPDYWSQAAAWLDDHPDEGRTLVLPGSNMATSIWGDPRDEPLQALVDSPWIVRDVVPLGSASAIRILNDIEARVATGYGGEELARSLSRLGVSRVLLRADLVPGGVRPLVARRALETAGAEPVQAFGPPVGGSFDPGIAADGGMGRPLRAVEVFELADDTRIAPNSVVPLSAAVEMSGGPEGLSSPVPADVPVVFAADVASVDAVGPARGVITDTLPRREATFSAVRDNYGGLLTAEEPHLAPRRVHDWVPSWVASDELTASQTTKVWVGGVEAEASSALTNPEFGQSRDLATDAARAFDRSGDTWWQSAGYEPVGEWVQADWPSAVTLPETVRVVIDAAVGADIAAVVTRTDQGEVRTPVSPPDFDPAVERDRYAFDVAVAPGPSTMFRLTVADVRDGRPTVRVLDIGADAIPRAEPWSAMPAVSAPVDMVAMETPLDRRPACVAMASGVLACNPATSRDGEQSGDLRRVFTLSKDSEFTLSGSVYPRSSSAAEELLKRLDGIEAEASSQWLEGPSVSPQLVLDGDPGTYWASDPDDDRPVLHVTWDEPRLVTGIRLEVDSDAAGRRPTRVEVSLDDGPGRTLPVPESGFIDLGTRRVSSVSVTVIRTTSQVTDGGADMPVVIGELTVSGEPWTTTGLGASEPVIMPCGFGPIVQVAGQTYPTEVRGTRGRLIAGEPLDLVGCETASVAAGEVRARLIASAEFLPRSLTLTTRPLLATPGTALEVDRWTSTHRVLSLSETTEADSLLVVRENANPGWVASAGGVELEPVTADGWAQGWVIPEGTTGSVELRFAPQAAFRLALVIGLVCAVTLVALSLRPQRTTETGSTAVPSPLNPSSWVGLVGVVVAAALVSGPGGVVVTVVAALLVRSVSHRAVVRVGGVIGAGLIAWATMSPWPAPMATNRDGVAQLLAMGFVALVVLGPWAPDPEPAKGKTSRPPARRVEDGTLDDVPAGRRDDGRDDGRGDDGDPEVPVEQLVAERGPNPEHDGHVPEKEAVADLAQIAQRAGPEQGREHGPGSDG
ncbi:DUF3367 domain-containing protein [Nostocoides sp. F2B08]|nr:DUF3367 domain-containing protein [Tetrasphaera sp. F2B08]